ncbi:hypothetical protein GCM10023069_24220 [Shinella granuli]
MSERAHYATLITAPQLAALQQSAPQSVVVIDCSFDLADPAAGREAYHAKHIRGAFYMHLDTSCPAPRRAPTAGIRCPMPTRSSPGCRRWG